MDPVVRAILATHDPTTSNQQRQQAFELLEKIKANPSETVKTSLRLVQSKDPRIQHYALHSVEVLIKMGWDKLDPGMRENLKKYACQLFSNGSKLQQHFLREKICDLVTQIALRDWPQRWGNMLPTLYNLAGVGKPQSDIMLNFMVLMIVRNLASQIIAFDPNVPEKRVREIQKGLQASMNPIRFLIIGLMTRVLKTKDSGGNFRGKAIGLCLEAISAVIDWVDPSFIFGPDGSEAKMKEGVLPMVVQAFNIGDFSAAAGEILAIVCQKKTMSKFNPILKMLWVPVLKTNEMVMNAKLEDPNARANLIVGVARPLRKLIRNHMDYLLIPERKSMRFHLFKFVLKLYGHDLIAVAKAGCETWIYIGRSRWEKAIDPEWREGMLSKLLETSLRQITRRPFVHETSEYETEQQHRVASSGLRSQVQMLLQILARKHPVQSISAIASSYVNTLKRVAEAKNKDMFEKAINELEGHNACLEHLTRAVKNADAAGMGKINAGLGGILRGLLSLPNGIPSSALIHRYQAFAMIQPLYSENLEALKAAVGALVAGVQYRPKGQEAVHPDRLDRDTKVARRRALMSLIAIAKKQRGKLVTMFGHLSRVVEAAMKKEGNLRDEEKMQMLECLIPITNAMPEPQQQIGFIMAIISNPLKKFDQQAEAFRDVDSFLSFSGMASMEAAASGKARENRQATWWALDLLRCIFRHTADRKPPLGLVAKLLPPKRISILLMLAGCCNKLLGPQFMGRAPLEIKVALEETRERMLERRATLGLSPERSELIRELHIWYRTTRACAYNLLGASATDSPRMFYQVANASTLGRTAFADLPTMPPIYLKVVLDQLLPQFLSSYPLQNKMLASAFEELLGSVMSALFSRLGRGWSEHVSRQAGSSEPSSSTTEADEIRAVSGLTDATRSFVTGLCGLLAVQHGVSGMRFVRNTFYPVTSTSGQNNTVDKKSSDDSKKKEANPYVPSEAVIRRSNLVVELILANPKLLQLLMALFMALMIWPDTPSNITACALVLRFLPATLRVKDASRVGPIIMRVFETSLRILSRLPKEVETSQHGSHIFLLSELYCLLVPRGMTQLRSLLQSIPGVTNQTVQELEKALASEKSDRAQKKAFKEFLLRYIIGTQANAGRCFAVKDLPEGFVATCKDLNSRKNNRSGNGGEEADDSLDSTFEWLFGR